jgi:hypothetical protein
MWPQLPEGAGFFFYKKMSKSGYEASHHSYQSNAEIKNEWSLTSTSRVCFDCVMLDQGTLHILPYCSSNCIIFFSTYVHTVGGVGGGVFLKVLHVDKDELYRVLFIAVLTPLIDYSFLRYSPV